MRVHRNTPRGLREKHYQRALTLELQTLGVKKRNQTRLDARSLFSRWNLEDCDHRN